MKIACTSASFARPLAEGALTQLEWLDLCANELEVDGVVFDTRHFPRTDDDYVAQLKKVATDLGLGTAALAADDALSTDAPWLQIAGALGAPLLVTRAPLASADPQAWGILADAARRYAGNAKRVNVTVAVRNVAGTMCETPADLRRLGKDVDSAWLRFALDAGAIGRGETPGALLEKTVIAWYAVPDVERFATPGDARAEELIATLARFRGYVVLERGEDTAGKDAYHAALARFATLRANALFANAHEP